jgi:hypothetical protein
MRRGDFDQPRRCRTPELLQEPTSRSRGEISTSPDRLLLMLLVIF